MKEVFSVQVVTNFNFDGQCAEAMALYEKAFGAHTDFVMHYRDADPRDFAQELTEAQKSYVYHGEMHIGGQRIMFCDNLDVPFQTSLALSLTVILDTVEEVQWAFAVLAPGGKVIYPLHSTTYSAQCAVLVDRYGFRWGLMTENHSSSL